MDETGAGGEASTVSQDFKITSYSSTKGLAVGWALESDRFAAGGHTWFIVYIPADGNGDGYDNEEFISVFLVLDDRRVAEDVEVKARWKFSLVDYAGEPPPSSPAGVVMVANDITCETTGTFGSGLARNFCGWSRFIRREYLEKSTYLWNNCLVIRCEMITVTSSTTGGSAAAAAATATALPPPDMDRQLLGLLSSGAGADVTFEVGGEMFTAHRCILAARSSVFMAELLGPMKEKTAACVRISDIQAEVFRALLHFIYTDSLPEMDMTETAVVMNQHLLIAADKYNMERLKRVCENNLKSLMDTSMIATTLDLAKQYGFHRLKEACVEFLRSPNNLKAAALESEDFKNLGSRCPSLLIELLQKIAC